MHRRIFLAALTCSPALTRAQLREAERIAVLHELVAVLGAAGEAVSKLTTGFKEMVGAGSAEYDQAAAERERDRLIDISRRTTNLIVSMNIRLVQSLDDYLALRNPSDEDWARVIGNVNSTLGSVHTLLADVQAERSEFVLEPAFLLLNRTLAARSSLLLELAALPAPATDEEREVLAEASEKYKVLIANAEQALKELNAYLKERE